MTIKLTKILTKQGLNNYINKQRYKSIEVVESFNRESWETLKRKVNNNQVIVIVLSQWKVVTVSERGEFPKLMSQSYL